MGELLWLKLVTMPLLVAPLPTPLRSSFFVKAIIKGFFELLQKVVNGIDKKYVYLGWCDLNYIDNLSLNICQLCARTFFYDTASKSFGRKVKTVSSFDPSVAGPERQAQITGQACKYAG